MKNFSILGLPDLEGFTSTLLKHESCPNQSKRIRPGNEKSTTDGVSLMLL